MQTPGLSCSQLMMSLVTRRYIFKCTILKYEAIFCKKKSEELFSAKALQNFSAKVLGHLILCVLEALTKT